MKLLVIAGIGVVVLGVGGYFAKSALSTSKNDAATSGALFAVKRGTMNVTITENGTLLAKNSEKVVYEGKRGGKITFLIEEGKTVEPGEDLCKLDAQELESQVQTVDLEIKKTEVDLKKAQTEFEIQKGENTANVEKAHIALDKATNELEKYRDGDAPKERRSLEIKIKEAETKHSRSKKKYEDSVKLLAQEYISKAQLDQDEIEFEQAQIALEASRRDLELFERYTLPMTMTEKQTAVNDAKRGLQNAELRAQNMLEEKEVAVRNNEQRLTSQKNNFDQLKKEVEFCTIKAKTPGLVLHGDPQQGWWNERMKVGGNVWSGNTLFTIPDLRIMQVQVQVHEADINKLKEKQPATITMDTYPGLVIKGEVTKIAQVAGSQNPWGGDDDVKKFKVEITMEEMAEVKLRPGISAKAEVFIDKLDDVLFVPRQAVFLEEGKNYCYAMIRGKPERKEIEIGVSSDTYTQISSGLNEGDVVLLYNPTLGESSEKKEETPKKAEEKPAKEAAAPSVAKP
ncbi:MAG: efflux RND transporter periplasmic adaptor subunit [Phycisphaerales bacterium]|nr:efflux RND transporter periplasmic adaptor subunit [Phycisphaerales bacterium]